MNDDFLDLLFALSENEVRFLIIGGYAVAMHGRPRATKDLDIWVEASMENAPRVMCALRAFGAPLFNLTEADLQTPGQGLMMGLPPTRIDVVTEIDGLRFEDAWPQRVTRKVGNLSCPVIGLSDLITNKRASARPQDLTDVKILEKILMSQKK